MSSFQKSKVELLEDITKYESQLAIFTESLKTDPTNQDLLKAKSDLSHLIDLTRTLAEKTVDNVEFDIPDDVEENVFVRAELTVSESAPFSVGDAVEVISGERPYAGVVLEVNPQGNTGHVKIWYFEYDAEVVLPLSDLGKIAKPTVKPSDLEVLPFKCQCRYMADQRWYDAEVLAKGKHGYTIQYTQYKQTEEVPINYLRKVLVKEKKAEDIVKEEFVVPQHLVILPTDTEEEKNRKKKKIKALKQKFKEKHVEAEITVVQNNWKSFVNKGIKKSVAGIQKSSMFASPETVEGKVGVTNSGKALTEFEQRKRHKFEG